MPRQQSKPPAYCRHAASGLAVVRIHGRDRYLGHYGSPESFQKYERALAEWRAGHAVRSAPVDHGTAPIGRQLSINELLIAYFTFARTYYGSSQKKCHIGVDRDS